MQFNKQGGGGVGTTGLVRNQAAKPLKKTAYQVSTLQQQEEEEEWVELVGTTG
jgi:hypothetical protein